MEFTKNRSPSRGRCAIAPRPFPCGSSVLTEVATASMVTVSNMPVRCLNCKSTGLVDGEEGGGGKLRSCGKCKTACYCGRECQQADWKYHKCECRHWKDGSEFQKYVNAVYDPSMAPQMVLDMFLALRCLVSLEGKIPPEVEEMEAQEFYMGSEDVERASVDTLLILLIPKKLLREYFTEGDEGDASEAREFFRKLLRRFTLNNFGILNDLQNVVASGLYPSASVLNHSCSPNCILTYRGDTVTIRTIRDVREGEELTHSYIDLCQTTEERREILQAEYGFKCDCERCTDEKYKQIDRIIYTGGMYRDKEEKDTPLNNYARCIDETVEEDSVEAMENEYLEYQNKLRCYENEGLVSLDKRIYHTHCMLHNNALLLGRYGEAEDHCTKMCEFLENTLQHVPLHPLLTLQQYTLADLKRENGKIEESAGVFEEVVRKMEITHEGSTLLEKAKESLKAVKIK